jgi:hypothetical protein
MHQSSVKSLNTSAHPKSSSIYKSPMSSKNTESSRASNTSHKRHLNTPTPHRLARPSSVNQSYDFSINTSKMFITGCLNKAKFEPEAIPFASFDLNACRDEINRLGTQVQSEVLLENKMMRGDWIKAKKSIDAQFSNEIKQHNIFNNQIQLNFKNHIEDKEKNAKIKERQRKNEEYLAIKEAKSKLEMEQKKQKLDDLERDRERFVKKQELLQNKIQQKKDEKNQERQSFLEFIDVFKQKATEEQIRENREREFEYAQGLGAKWIKLVHQDQVTKENIQVIEKLINK